MWLSRVLLCLGLMAGTLSMWDTLAHSWDPAFQAPALPLGPTHSNYHAFREFTLSVGAAAVLLYGMFLPATHRARPVWVMMGVTAVGYYGGWWLPGPLLDLHAPNRLATIVHLAASILSLASVGLAWPSYSAVNRPAVSQWTKNPGSFPQNRTGRETLNPNLQPPQCPSP